MTDKELREAFQAVIDKIEDPDKRAEAEFLREYFTNEAFRQYVHDTTFAIAMGDNN